MKKVAFLAVAALACAVVSCSSPKENLPPAAKEYLKKYEEIVIRFAAINKAIREVQERRKGIDFSDQKAVDAWRGDVERLHEQMTSITGELEELTKTIGSVTGSFTPAQKKFFQEESRRIFEKSGDAAQGLGTEGW